MSMKSRIAKLEADMPDTDKEPTVLIVTFVSPDPNVEDKPGPATVIGRPGRIWPHDDESMDEFEVRVDGIAQDFKATRNQRAEDNGKNRNMRGRP